MEVFLTYARPVVYLCTCLHDGVFKIFNETRMLTKPSMNGMFFHVVQGNDCCLGAAPAETIFFLFLRFNALLGRGPRNMGQHPLTRGARGAALTLSSFLFSFFLLREASAQVARRVGH